jgi:hypothetical protein
MDGIKWIDHIIDFFVIFGADLLAAFVALKWFEARKDANQKAEKSLNELLRFAGIFQARYKQLSDRFQNSDDSSGTGLPNDPDDDDREFAQLDFDSAFWAFKNATSIKQKYDKVKALKENIRVNTVGEAKTKLAEILTAIAELESDIKKKNGL